jgi:hypothetical protein
VISLVPAVTAAVAGRPPVHDPEGSSRPLPAVPGPPGLGAPLSTRESAAFAEKFIAATCAKQGITRGQLTLHATGAGLPTAACERRDKSNLTFACVRLDTLSGGSPPRLADRHFILECAMQQGDLRPGPTNIERESNPSCGRLPRCSSRAGRSRSALNIASGSSASSSALTRFDLPQLFGPTK